jgi:hypothetical protein
LRTVENGELFAFDEFVSLSGRKSERIAIAFQREKKFGAFRVFPLARVYRSAAKSDDDGQVLDADGALVFAGAAGGALKWSYFRDVDAQQRLFRCQAEVIHVSPHAESDFTRIEYFACVIGGTVFGAAAAFDAGKRL